MDLYRGNTSWKKKECPQLRTRRVKKSSGQIDICVGMFFCMVVLLAVLFQIKLRQYQAVGAFVEDSLAASNLASAVIDIEEYGKSHRILIESPENAFFRYRETLIYNLKLDDGLCSTNNEVIRGKVDILSYQVFNVQQELVSVYCFGENGELLETRLVNLEEAFLPDGNKVETTSVYSKIGFYVTGLAGELIYGTKENSVDIKGEGL